MSTGKWFAVSWLFPPLLVLVSVAQLEAASFQGLGHLPGDDSSRAKAVSADGSVVVGVSRYRVSTPFGPEIFNQSFRWTADGGMVGLGGPFGGDSCGSARAVSADGSVVVGSTGPYSSQVAIGILFDIAYRWTSDGGMVPLDYVPRVSRGHSADDLSADGSVVVGVRSTGPGSEAFRWTSDGGIVGLGFLPGGRYELSNAYGVSADGSVVVGSSHCASGEEAFRWTADGGMVGLGDLPGSTFRSVAYDVSADGSVAVGESNSELGQAYEAFRWTSDGGMVGLGFLPGPWANLSTAHGASGDGSVVVGKSASAFGNAAFIWDNAHGMRSLQDVLTNDVGLDLAGWTLYSAYGISDDGTVIVGSGRNPLGNTEAWRAVIPEPSSVVLALSGLAGLLAYAWRKRRRA